MKALILGSGGHGRSLHALILAGEFVTREKFETVGFCVPDLSGNLVLPSSEIVLDSELKSSEARDTVLVNGMGLALGIQKRTELYSEFSALGFPFHNLISKSAYFGPNKNIHRGWQVFPTSMVHPSSNLGSNVVIGSGAVIEHDVEIEEGAFIGPNATVLGGAKVGSSAVVGAGAVVLPGRLVPGNSLVKAATRF